MLVLNYNNQNVQFSVKGDIFILRYILDVDENYLNNKYVTINSISDLDNIIKDKEILQQAYDNIKLQKTYGTSGSYPGMFYAKEIDCPMKGNIVLILSMTT